MSYFDKTKIAKAINSFETAKAGLLLVVSTELFNSTSCWADDGSLKVKARKELINLGVSNTTISRAIRLAMFVDDEGNPVAPTMEDVQSVYKEENDKAKAKALEKLGVDYKPKKWNVTLSESLPKKTDKVSSLNATERKKLRAALMSLVEAIDAC